MRTFIVLPEADISILRLIELIMHSRFPERRKEQLYFTDPASVIRRLRPAESAVVISDRKLTDTGAVEFGEEFAEQVKDTSSHAWFFVYSLLPSTGHGVDGIIARESGFINPARSVLIDFLSRDWSGKTLNHVKLEMPEFPGSKKFPPEPTVIVL